MLEVVVRACFEVVNGVELFFLFLACSDPQGRCGPPGCCLNAGVCWPACCLHFALCYAGPRMHSNGSTQYSIYVFIICVCLSQQSLLSIGAGRPRPPSRSCLALVLCGPASWLFLARLLLAICGTMPYWLFVAPFNIADDR